MKISIKPIDYKSPVTSNQKTVITCCSNTVFNSIVSFEKKVQEKEKQDCDPQNIQIDRKQLKTSWKKITTKQNKHL